jgi:hypothetical protein
MCQQAACGVYSVTAIISSVRSISDKMLSLVAFLVAGGVVVVAAFTVALVTVFAVGLLAHAMKRSKSLLIGLVGMNPLIHDRIKGFTRSPACVT